MSKNQRKNVQAFDRAYGLETDYNITLDFSKPDRHRRVDSLHSDPTGVGMTFTVLIDELHHHGASLSKNYKCRGVQGEAGAGKGQILIASVVEEFCIYVFPFIHSPIH